MEITKLGAFTNEVHHMKWAFLTFAEIFVQQMQG